MQITLIQFVILLFILVIIYKYIENRTYEVVYVKSSLNNREYLVRNLDDKQAAADLLATISLKLENLVEIINSTNIVELFTKYVSVELQKELYADSTTSSTTSNTTSDNDIEVKIRATFTDDIKRLISNFNPANFSENTPDSKYTSYSVNKGEKIVFCLRDKNADERLVNENIMMFVSIHELAHLMTKSVGHEPEFWNNFKILLRIAIDHNLYEYVDFNSKPKKYCGTEITDTPLKL